MALLSLLAGAPPGTPGFDAPTETWARWLEIHADPHAKLSPQALAESLVGDGSGNYRETASYDLEARLRPDEKTVETRGTVRWTNRGTLPVRALWWHLYLNAFKNDASLFARESGGLADTLAKRGEWGWIELVRMGARRVGEVPVDLLPTATFEHPDEGEPGDQTVMRTPLPFEVAPGETVELDIDFVSKLPRVVARSGYGGTFFMVAQWFPKLGVLEETVRGRPVIDEAGEPVWSCPQYHAISEFFADYGAYRVAITVPKGHRVGATGKLLETRDGVDEVTFVYAQDRVHDFAWTADPRFVEQVRTFEAAKVPAEDVEEAASLLGLPPGQLTLRDVQVRLLIQPEHEAWADRYFEAIFAGLKWFGLWYGAYPYDVLTVVDGPVNAGAAMGMEYPTLFTAGVRWPSPEGTLRPESVTVHELGHQFFHGLVGTNEFEEPWLDEGFTEYLEGKVLDRAYGPFNVAPRIWRVPLIPWFPDLRIDQLKAARIGTMTSPTSDRVARRSWEFRSDRSYGVNSYPRAALTLRQLERVMGRAAMARAMRLYHLRWRYRHPTGADFIRAAQDVAGHSLGAYFDRAVYSPGAVDYAITELQTSRITNFSGVFDREDAAPLEHTSVSIVEASAADDAVPAEARRYRTEVVVERLGEVDLPVTVEVKFEDGSRERWWWDGRYRWARFIAESNHRAESARVDPDDELVLDLARINDSRTIAADRRPAVAATSQALYLVQTLWQLLGGLL